ncbi:hypothetical protein ACJA23_03335 [Mycoplasma corogypsi]|uniref:hypothetical protein n=1 Tax=Mycoplasma corogypsi TaxID=2106 RepID=UPI003872AE0F
MDRYENKIKQIWKIERNKLKDEIKRNGLPDWLEFKIQKTVSRMNLDKKYINIIKTSILKDDLLLSFFMKDPKRQNIYENIFKDELIKEGLDIQKLPQNGSKAFYLLNDEVVSNPVNKPKELKSLDFVINKNGRQIYVVNKYTNEPGGAQDDQYNDVITQLKNLGDNTCDKVLFCLDGNYYTDDKISKLREINYKAHIINIEQLIKRKKEL